MSHTSLEEQQAIRVVFWLQLYMSSYTVKQGSVKRRGE